MVEHKAAVIGLGRMGAIGSPKVQNNSPICWTPLSHAAAISCNSNLTLNAICDSDRQRISQCQDQYGIQRSFTTIDDLFNNAPIDLLTIATRTIGRQDLIIKAYNHGIKAIHTEKPLCNSLSELNTLKTLFSDPDFFVTLGTLRRYMPNYRYCKNLIDQEVYGKLKSIKFNLGLAQLYWSHPHTIDLFLFFNSEAKISCVKSSIVPQTLQYTNSLIQSDPVIEEAIIHFDNGVDCIINNDSGLDLVLICEKATLIIKNDGEYIQVKNHTMATTPKHHETMNFNDPNGLYGSYLPIELLRKCLDNDSSAIHENKCIKEDIINGQLALFSLVQSHLMNSAYIRFNEIDPNIKISAYTSGLPA